VTAATASRVPHSAYDGRDARSDRMTRGLAGGPHRVPRAVDREDRAHWRVVVAVRRPRRHAGRALQEARRLRGRCDGRSPLSDHDASPVRARSDATSRTRARVRDAPTSRARGDSHDRRPSMASLPRFPGALRASPRVIRSMRCARSSWTTITATRPRSMASAYPRAMCHPMRLDLEAKTCVRDGRYSMRIRPPIWSAGRPTSEVGPLATTE
jgi:hypothetical protein